MTYMEAQFCAANWSINMRVFKGKISTDKIGSTCEFEFEVEDTATDDEIEQAARDAAFEHIEWNFNEVKPSTVA